MIPACFKGQLCMRENKDIYDRVKRDEGEVFFHWLQKILNIITLIA